MSESASQSPLVPDEEHEGPQCGACGYQHEFGAMGAQFDGMTGAVECCPRCGYAYPVPPAAVGDFDDLRDDTVRYTLSDAETDRRLPALDLIEDDRIRAETRRLSGRAPPYFWLVPASRSDYHHPLCRETRGLWAHTLMVVAAYERLAPSYLDRNLITETEVDLGRAACILHDQRKEGPHHYPEGSSTSDHDLQMADVVRNRSGLDDRVADAVASHMGPWYDGPRPATPLEELVHSADMMASTANATLTIPGPVPHALNELGVTEGEF